MKEETRQQISRAVKQMREDLSNWLLKLGIPEAELMTVFPSVISENGLASKLLIQKSVEMVPFSSEFPPQPRQFELALAFIKSEEFEAWLLTAPEPTPEELEKILTVCRESLPNLRQNLLGTAKMGPRYRHGGRPKELPDPEQRRKVRDEIKSLRGPGTKLKDLFGRLAQKYQVSETTIKRIWEEKTEYKS